MKTFQTGKILFLGSEYPYPANSGGKIAHLNHIKAINDLGYEMTKVFLDTDSTSSTNSTDLTHTVFKLNKIESSLLARFHYYKGVFFSKYPRVVYIRRIKTSIKYIENLFKTKKYKIVFFEHLSAFAFVNPESKTKDITYVYIAQNVESKLSEDEYKFEKSFLKRILLYIDFKKICYFENKFIGLSDLVITISSHDFSILSQRYKRKKIINIPELLPLKQRTWEYNGSRNIVFIGATTHFPNYDAVEWLVTVFMPGILKLDSKIRLVIIGNTDNYKHQQTYNSSAIIFKGRVSDDDLESICLNSSLFISPVVYGSGTKIKILEAASLGLPLISTLESLLGNDFLNKDIFSFDRNDLKSTFNKVIEILDKKETQVSMSNNIKSSLNVAYKKNEYLWNSIVDKLL